MLLARSEMYLQTTDDGLVWVDSSEASDYFSPKEGKDDAVLGVVEILGVAKALKAKSGKKLSKFIPEWLLHFMNDKNELDEDDLRSNCMG